MNSLTPAGQFWHRVTILKRDTGTRNETGETIPQDIPEQSKWAKVTTPQSDERYRAAEVYEDVTHVVTLRYTPDLTSRDRLKYKGRILDIASLINVNEQGVELVALCKEQR